MSLLSYSELSSVNLSQLFGQETVKYKSSSINKRNEETIPQWNQVISFFIYIEKKRFKTVLLKPVKKKQVYKLLLFEKLLLELIKVLT